MIWWDTFISRNADNAWMWYKIKSASTIDLVHNQKMGSFSILRPCLWSFQIFSLTFYKLVDASFQLKQSSSFILFEWQCQKQDSHQAALSWCAQSSGQNIISDAPAGMGFRILTEDPFILCLCQWSYMATVSWLCCQIISLYWHIECSAWRRLRTLVHSIVLVERPKQNGDVFQAKNYTHPVLLLLTQSCSYMCHVVSISGMI